MQKLEYLWNERRYYNRKAPFFFPLKGISNEPRLFSLHMHPLNTREEIEIGNEIYLGPNDEPDKAGNVSNSQ